MSTRSTLRFLPIHCHENSLLLLYSQILLSIDTEKNIVYCEKVKEIINFLASIFHINIIILLAFSLAG